MIKCFRPLLSISICAASAKDAYNASPSVSTATTERDIGIAGGKACHAAIVDNDAAKKAADATAATAAATAAASISTAAAAAYNDASGDEGPNSGNYAGVLMPCAEGFIEGRALPVMLAACSPRCNS